MNSSQSATVSSSEYPDYARRGLAGLFAPGKTLRELTAELGSTPQRWRRAARIALLTALGAGVTAALQISNALGLTLLFNFAAPEMALSFTAAVRFLFGAALLQALGLALAGAMADSAISHLTIFVVLSLASGYLIYADPRIGRLWVWVQVPVLTAFYLVIFDPNGFGWTDEQAFAGVAVAVAILYVANTLLWPRPAVAVLSESLANTVGRSRRRLKLLLDIWAGVDGPEPKDDRPVASKLGYHLTLLAPAARASHSAQLPGVLLAAVMVAERIHNEIDRIAELVSQLARGDLDSEVRTAVLGAGAELDAMLEDYANGLADRAGDLGQAGDAGRSVPTWPRDGTDGPAAGTPAGPAAALRRRLLNIRVLLDFNPAEVPSPLPVPHDAAPADVCDASGPAADVASVGTPRPRPNRFLLRYTIRHTIAMVLAFGSGLFANNPAMHAALWLLMIGGPPSHGATVRKFTIRAIGAAAALALAALGALLLAPNGTTVFSYMVAIFAGSLLMAYIGEGGGLLSYLSIGGTAFVIAFSGPGPRNDAFASIWTIWGIAFGMLIRAAVSLVWRERARRTLVEELQSPMEALVVLVSAAHRRGRSAAEVDQAQMALIKGVREMLSVAADAQLEGRSAGIDAANLVDALDTLRRVGFILGNQAMQDVPAAQQVEDEALHSALHARFADWLESLRVQDGDGVPSLAPLREMVLNCDAPDLGRWADSGGQRQRLVELVRMLEEQFKTVSVY